MKDHCNDPHENLAWLDLETTGLRPYEDAILEIGVVITDRELDTVTEWSWVMQPSNSVNLVTIDPFVWKMHRDNGLWDECIGNETYLEDVVIEAQDFVREHGAAGSPLCGNNIGFDRGFLKAQAPELLRIFHYRNIDVSTLKNVFALHLPHIPAFDKPKGNHRALGDCHLSIAEYRHYLNYVERGL